MESKLKTFKLMDGSLVIGKFNSESNSLESALTIMQQMTPQGPSVGLAPVNPFNPTGKIEINYKHVVWSANVNSDTEKQYESAIQQLRAREAGLTLPSSSEPTSKKLIIGGKHK